MKNGARSDHAATSPPTAGPLIPPSRKPPENRPLARPRWLVGTVPRSRAWALTLNMAEPTPPTPRRTMSWAKESENPARMLLAATIAIPAAITPCSPNRSFVELMVLRGSGGVGSAMFSISAQALLLGTVPPASAAGPAACSAAASCSAGSAAPRWAGWWRRGRCGRRSSSTAACSWCPRSWRRSCYAGCRTAARRPARVGRFAGNAGPRGSEPHLAGGRVGQPGRRLRRARRARRPSAAVRP